MEVKAAICQRPPVLLDKKASMAAALAMAAEAAGQGAKLMTFPEAFLPGYPTWVWRLRPGADMALGNEIHRQLQRNRHQCWRPSSPAGSRRTTWHGDRRGDA